MILGGVHVCDICDFRQCCLCGNRFRTVTTACTTLTAASRAWLWWCSGSFWRLCSPGTWTSSCHQNAVLYGGSSINHLPRFVLLFHLPFVWQYTYIYIMNVDLLWKVFFFHYVTFWWQHFLMNIRSSVHNLSVICI